MAKASGTNQEYNITGQAANLASQGVSGAARSGRWAAQVGRNASAHALAWKEEHNLTGKDAKAAMNGLVRRLDRLAGHGQQGVSQAHAMNEESGMEGQASRKLRCVASRAASFRRSAAQKLSAWKDGHQVTEQAVAAAAEGAGHVTSHHSDFEQKHP